MSLQKFDWRKHLPVHPAADLFPLMSEAELKELAADIEKNGLQVPIVLWTPLRRKDLDTYGKRRKGRDEINAKAKWQVIDGRNRLDALALIGAFGDDDGGWILPPSPDDFCNDFVFKYGDEWDTLSVQNQLERPYDLSSSFNIYRRHFSAEQKREQIAKALKAKPEASDRQIAKQTNSSPTTVGAVRKEKEASGDVSKLGTRKDTKGRKQPANKPKREKPKAKPIEPESLGNPIEEPCEDCDTPQEFWQRSLANLAGDAISLRPYWTRQFGKWETFEASSDLVTLAEQAAQAWSELAADLRKRNKPKAAA